jgi:hypothetical protein
MRRATATHGAKVGGKATTEYTIWRAMKSRCSNPATINYSDYGGRGIAVCDRWRDDFAAFLADMGPRPSPDHSIDRRDNSGPYSPDNCRWSTSTEQSNNRRVNRMLSHQGRTQTLAQWSRELGLSRVTLADRLDAGWPVEKAFGPSRRYRTSGARGRSKLAG